MNNYFQFKQFLIRQEETAMKVGTDGVLLGAWAEVESASSILDIGTGTGLIALMSAQRNPHAFIEAVEIDESAYRQACENVANSPWKERIRLIHLSIFDFQPGHLFDCILCNPPFFKSSTPAPQKNRTLARHCYDFSHQELLHVCSRLLTGTGRCHLILPVLEAEQLLFEAPACHLFCQKITKVRPTPQKAAKRYLLTFGKTESPVQYEELIIEYARHQYSPEYRKLTSDFYLSV